MTALDIVANYTTPDLSALSDLECEIKSNRSTTDESRSIHKQPKTSATMLDAQRHLLPDERPPAFVEPVGPKQDFHLVAALKIRSEKVGLVPRPILAVDPVSRVLERVKDVVDVHDHARAERREDPEQIIEDV